MKTTFDLTDWVRPNVLKMKAYSSARSEFTGKADIYLDANEHPVETGLNRYPDPLQKKLKIRISKIKSVDPKNIFLGNGSDEVIDLLIRIFCQPRIDNIITLPPTYGMYKVSAALSDVTIQKVPLTPDFQPDVPSILEKADQQSKLLFLCHPNNPTGNNMSEEAIRSLLSQFSGIVVVDEAYIDFSEQQSCISLLEEFPNLVVMQTFSKAWGLAGIRLGMAFASEAIIQLLNKVKPPYNINSLTQEVALKALDNVEQKDQYLKHILAQREILKTELIALPFVQKIFPTDTNFLLVKMDEPVKVYHYLLEQKIIVRDRSQTLMCEGCLRFTVGTTQENNQLIEALQNFVKK